MREIKSNKLFVNIYEITQYKTSGNTIKVVGCVKGKSVNDAKQKFEKIHSDGKFSNPKYSIQLQDYDARNIKA